MGMHLVQVVATLGWLHLGVPYTGSCLTICSGRRWTEIAVFLPHQSAAASFSVQCDEQLRLLLSPSFCERHLR